MNLTHIPPIQQEPTRLPEGQAPTMKPRWTKDDEMKCGGVCKYCGGPISWGEVDEWIGEFKDHKPGKKRHGKFLPLDPDGMPHGCKR